MPLEIYRRGHTWWARGRIDYRGQAISDYYRCSTGASSEDAARRWCAEEEERAIRHFHLGSEGDARPLTFAEAVTFYPAKPKEAAYLEPVLDRLGAMTVAAITPRAVRDLGAEIYPDAATDTWTRQVISPVRAVINHAHDLGLCGPIRIKGYDAIERQAQDRRRGKLSRVKRTPGDWQWLLKFRQHADRRVAALAMFMFMTGARISQAIAMHPAEHLDLQNGRACIPGAKGTPDRWISIPPELVAELANLPTLYPRGLPRKPEYARLFGYADRSSPRKAWDKACAAAGIARLPFHAAGRHGFGQEMNVRQPVDEKAAGAFGGWQDTGLMRRTYTHAEAAEAKVHAALAAGRKKAEAALKKAAAGQAGKSAGKAPRKAAAK